MKVTLLLLMMIFVAVQSFAQGNGAGNGGVAIVCRTDGKIKFAQLLDFYEAENDPDIRIPIIQSNAPYEEQIADRIDAIRKSGVDYGSNWHRYNAPLVEFDILYFLKKVTSTMEKEENWIVDPTVGIWIPNDPDFHPRVFRNFPGCGFEMVARHVRGNIVWNRALFDALSPSHRAGVVLHEAIYWAYRENTRAVDSDEARLTLGHLFDSRPKNLSYRASERLYRLVSAVPDEQTFISRHSSSVSTQFEFDFENKQELKDASFRIFGENFIVHISSSHLGSFGAKVLDVGESVSVSKQLCYRANQKIDVIVKTTHSNTVRDQSVQWSVTLNMAQVANGEVKKLNIIRREL